MSKTDIHNQSKRNFHRNISLHEPNTTLRNNTVGPRAHIPTDHNKTHSSRSLYLDKGTVENQTLTRSDRLAFWSSNTKQKNSAKVHSSVDLNNDLQVDTNRSATHNDEATEAVTSAADGLLSALSATTEANYRERVAVSANSCGDILDISADESSKEAVRIGLGLMDLLATLHATSVALATSGTWNRSCSDKGNHSGNEESNFREHIARRSVVVKSVE